MIITRQRSWFELVTPDREDMDAFLRGYIGADAWRTPRRLWRRMHHSKAGILLAENRIPKFRRYQRGNFAMFPAGTTAKGAPGTVPNLQDITNATSSSSPTASRQQYAWDSDGGVEGDTDATTEASIVYADLTTQTDDSNDHTNDWWPDQPETNIGLDYDIRYDNEALTGNMDGVIADHLLPDNTGTDRVSGTWYLLDTVSNDHGDATHDGGIGVNRNNGIGKSPEFGVTTLNVDVEIRATGSGSALATCHLDLDVEGT